MNLKPSYPLQTVKTLLKGNNYQINTNASDDALDDFNWGPQQIVQCLLKLNSRHYIKNPQKNHFYKTEDHRRYPHTKMDYYKAQNIMEGFDVYTHFYISPSTGKLVISSFKEL